MTDWQQYGVAAAMFGGMVLAFAGVQGQVPPAFAVPTALAGSLLSGAAFGIRQHAENGAEHDERSIAVRYRSGYVTFWAVYGALFVLAVGGLGAYGAADVGFALSTDALAVVASLWTFGSVVVIASRLWYRRQF
ncbi:MAG: hypothetical protein ABEJ85_02330 [Haloarculaceae archaeon]